MSTSTRSQKNRPTHRVYAVTKRANGENNAWDEIGAAWAHADGKGFALKLNYLPINGAELVVRVPTPKAEAQEGGAA